MLLVTAFKNFACLIIFNGVLLSDPHKLLEPAGPNTRLVPLAKFTNSQNLKGNLAYLHAYIFESIEISKAGIKVEKKKAQDPIPPELQTFFDKDPEFKSSLESLTPARQRGYLLHFNAAKKRETRISRIEKHYDKINAGIGFHDR